MTGMKAQRLIRADSGLRSQENYGDSLSFRVNGGGVAKYVLGIRCIAVEEFSRGFIRSRLRAKESERDQLLGAVTERKGPCKGVGRENHICEEEFMAIDPVCGMKVDENRPEFQTQFAGKKYFFCSEDCQSEFENRPDEFATVTAA